MSGGKKRQEYLSTTFAPDQLRGFEVRTLRLPDEGDGALAASLIRTRGPDHDDRPAVLQLHGVLDYFFHEHVAHAFEAAGYRFYALDLRRHGRSIRPGNRPNMAWSIDDYFEEISWAIENILVTHPRLAALIGHSTGGLTASLYAHRGPHRTAISRLILNSPFFRFYLGPLTNRLVPIAAALGRVAPATEIVRQVNGTYGRTIHSSQEGEWDYDLDKRPLDGFPMRAGWFEMIRAAHAEVEEGLDIRCPVLSLHSDRSRLPGRTPSAEDFVSDIVLDVEDIKRISPKLGANVQLEEVRAAIHDVTLSALPVRTKAIEAMIAFVNGSDGPSR